MEEWQFGRPRDMQRRTELYEFGVGARGIGAICCLVWNLTIVWPMGGEHLFSVNPSPKDQAWDHIGPVESMCVPCLGDVLGTPRPHTAGTTSPRAAWETFAVGQ